MIPLDALLHACGSTLAGLDTSSISWVSPHGVLALVETIQFKMESLGSCRKRKDKAHHSKRRRNRSSGSDQRKQQHRRADEDFAQRENKRRREQAHKAQAKAREARKRRAQKPSAQEPPDGSDLEKEVDEFFRQMEKDFHRGAFRQGGGTFFTSSSVRRVES